MFTKADLTVRVGIKETAAPRHICYCFNHTVEEIEEEVHLTGKTTVLAAISDSGFTGRFANVETRTILISGMTCATCAAHVQAELSKVPGVRSATVSYQEQKAVAVADSSVTSAIQKRFVSRFTPDAFVSFPEVRVLVFQFLVEPPPWTSLQG